MTDRPSAPVRVLLVDDDPLVRTGLRLMLRGATDLEVVGEVADGTGVVDAVSRLLPDVVLMDVRMPYLDGIAATRALSARGDGAPAVIVLTTFGDDANVVAALRAGAAGFLLKHAGPDEIVDAVRRSARGEPVLSPTVTRTLIDRLTTGPVENVRSAEARKRMSALSRREREVAAAVAEGLANSEIAERLYMSVSSVKAHISSALTRLDLSNRIQLAILAHDAADH
ncbi:MULTISPECIES: response regulator transcription factor [Actinomadura]|uniref:Response regulator n=1 Tax=Actinomadura litoris TaxID=2678616 RepID=A0A7K1L205_9ACTN|nr:MULTISPECIES: response regulator transcription factor [Actinomadura]MBT2206565.1 response regulator transcription factor [Actinomadura sp. NEAU-AAG7]MUN38333.1 response regulator [Actinomadura litoris]